MTHLLYFLTKSSVNICGIEEKEAFQERQGKSVQENMRAGRAPSGKTGPMKGVVMRFYLTISVHCAFCRGHCYKFMDLTYCRV